jgi:hypothetical protein
VLGELGISAALEYGDRISVFCGYRLMWLERVAIASDQIEDTDFFLGTGSDDRGRSIFHGANFGMQLQL